MMCQSLYMATTSPSGVFDDIVKDFKKYWIIKVRAILGPEQGDEKEVSILNRVVRWSSGVIEYEADPMHVKKLLRDMGMEGCRGLSTAGVKPSSEEVRSIGGGPVPYLGTAHTAGGIVHSDPCCYAGCPLPC